TAKRIEQPRKADVDSVEEPRLFSNAVSPSECGKPLVVSERRTCRGLDPTAVLRALEAQSEPRDVRVGVAEPRAVLAGVGAQRPLLVLAHAAHVQLQRLPRAESVAQLLGKDRWIAGDAPRFLRQQTGRLMIAVAVALVALEAGDEHERTIDADDPDDVAQHVLAAPFRERFFEPLREPVVDGGGEILPIDAVVTIGEQQFFGPDQPDSVEQLRPDGVVAGLAAGERQERDPRAVAAAQL